MSMKILALDGLNDSKLCKLMGSLLQTIPGVDYANIDYLSQKLTLQMSGRDTARIIDRVSIMIKENMPGVSIRLKDVSNIDLDEKPLVHKDSGMHLDIARAISTMVNDEKGITTKSEKASKFEKQKPSNDDFAPASFNEVSVSELSPEQIKSGQSKPIKADLQKEETIEEVIAQLNKTASEDSQINADNTDNAEENLDDDIKEENPEQNSDENTNEEENSEKSEKISFFQKLLSKMSKEMVVQLFAIAISFLLLLVSLPFNKESFVSFIFSVIPFITLSVFAMICDPGKHKTVSFVAPLITVVASAVLFFAGGRTPAVIALLLFHVGYFSTYFLYEYTYNKIEGSIDIQPKTLVRFRDGVTQTVPFDEVWSGDEIVLKKGDTVPFDSIITNGGTMVDDSFISGKDDPVAVLEGGYLNCGSIITGDTIRCAQVGLQKNSIAAVVRSAVLEDNPHATKLSQQARMFPVFFFLLQLLITLIAVAFFISTDKIDSCIYFLPIAILLLVPTGISNAIEAMQHAALSRALKNGIVIVSSAILEELAQVKTVITGLGGVITKNVFHVTDVKLSDNNLSEIDEENEDAKEDLVQSAAYAEFKVEHPIAEAITTYYTEQYEKQIMASRIAFCEINTGGVRAMSEARIINVGSAAYMEKSDIDVPPNDSGSTCVYVSRYGEHAGTIFLRDEKREGTEKLGFSLKALGITKTVLLTGREKSIAEHIGRKCGYDSAYGDMSQTQKIDTILSIMTTELVPNALIYAGNVDDAEVLGKTCPCIAMGENCLTSMFYAAKALIPCGQPIKLIKAFRIAKETQLFSFLNMGILFALKLVLLVLALFGIVPFLAAALIDIGLTILQAACPALTLKD